MRLPRCFPVTFLQPFLAIDAANPAHPFHKFGTGNLTTLFERPKAKNLDVRHVARPPAKSTWFFSSLRIDVSAKQDCALGFPQQVLLIERDEAGCPGQRHGASFSSFGSDSLVTSDDWSDDGVFSP
jgi:hypothetical protein